MIGLTSTGRLRKTEAYVDFTLG